MLTPSNLKPRQKKARKRVGRGSGSGHGTYSGRGIKGQRARTGGNLRPGFEGGRMPLIRLMPKLGGFKSPHPKAQAVRIADVEKAFQEGEVVTARSLAERRLIRDARLPVKILGKDRLTKKLDFKGINFSAPAKQAVSSSGGRILEK